MLIPWRVYSDTINICIYICANQLGLCQGLQFDALLSIPAKSLNISWQLRQKGTRVCLQKSIHQHVLGKKS